LEEPFYTDTLSLFPLFRRDLIFRDAEISFTARIIRLCSAVRYNQDSPQSPKTEPMIHDEQFRAASEDVATCLEAIWTISATGQRHVKN